MENKNALLLISFFFELATKETFFFGSLSCKKYNVFKFFFFLGPLIAIGYGRVYFKDLKKIKKKISKEVEGYRAENIKKLSPLLIGKMWQVFGKVYCYLL